MNQQQIIQITVTAVIVIIVLFFRMRGMTKQRRLRIEQLWIVPAIFAVICALVMWQTPPTLADAPWLVLALAIGAVIGWYRGKMMRITVDPQTQALNQSASPAAMIFILVIFAARYAMRVGLAEESEAWHISLNLLTDAPLVFVLAMFATTRVEMFIRARRLLAQARAAHSSSPITDAPQES